MVKLKKGFNWVPVTRNALSFKLRSWLSFNGCTTRHAVCNEKRTLTDCQRLGIPSWLWLKCSLPADRQDSSVMQYLSEHLVSALSLMWDTADWLLLSIMFDLFVYIWCLLWIIYCVVGEHRGKGRNPPLFYSLYQLFVDIYVAKK